MKIKLPSSKIEVTIKDTITGRDRIILKRSLSNSFVFKNVADNQEVSFKDLTPAQAIEVEIQTMLIYVISAKNDQGEDMKVERNLIAKILDGDEYDYLEISTAIQNLDKKRSELKKK